MTQTSPSNAVPQNPVEVPLYTDWDLVRYLRLPFWAVLTLDARHPIDPYGQRSLFPYDWPDLEPVIDDDPAQWYPNRGPRVSFQRFAELFVRAAAIQAFLNWQQSRLPNPAMRRDTFWTVHRILMNTRHQSVFDDSFTPTLRAEHLAEPYAEKLDDHLLTLIRKWFAVRLERVELEAGVPVRVYPFTRDPAIESPRIIVLDPRVRFGRPTIAGQGVPADIVCERHQAGDSVAELAEDYGVSTGEIEEAIRFGAAPLGLTSIPVW